MPVYKLYLLTLLFCAGCTSAPNIFDLSPKEEANHMDINPLIPKENIITRTNPKKYTGELIEKVTYAELTITQAYDFILLASGVIESAVAYDPRLIPVTTEEPNTLKYSFKARYVSKKNENRTITTAITLGTKKLENIDKILIESKNTIFELKL
ncbi:MAG: hypothetical protein CBB98_11290 [Rhodobacteraceae bacterium TMED38]|nr:MAG: hypothetical protein CBB98_11290 [Rhodobacteraceae bacterium TMED38]